MKILVTGASGQLGRDLVPMLKARNYNVLPTARADVNFANPAQVADAVYTEKPDCVINCAAYTQVDQAEDDIDMANIVNGESVGTLAKATADLGCHLIHISTDYIFDGKKAEPYLEGDKPNPLNQYGRSKWAGEKLIHQYANKATVIRTSWVYGSQGNNFVKTILKYAKEREELSVVNDQIGSPTWTQDLAQSICHFINREEKCCDTLHFTNEGVASWYDFATAIVDEARLLGMGLKVKTIKPVITDAFPRPARRPSISILSKQKAGLKLPYAIPYWRLSLKNMLKELIQCEG
jgi:dTDP-4-dehydrorhamnose reductase